MRLFLISIGLLLVMFGLFACNHQNGNIENNSLKGEAQGDWPALSLDELISDADLISFVTVKDIERKEKNNGIHAQIAILEAQEVISGSASKKIKLDQSTNFVKKGEDYLLFLKKGKSDEFYYALNPSGIIHEKKGLYETGLVEQNGKYKKEELKRLLFNER